MSATTTKTEKAPIAQILAELGELRTEIAKLKQGAARAHGPVLDGLLTPAMLSARIGQTERTLSEWRITGTGPAYIRVGRGVRYRPEAVDAWLLSRERQSTAGEYR